MARWQLPLRAVRNLGRGRFTARDARSRVADRPHDSAPAADDGSAAAHMAGLAGGASVAGPAAAGSRGLDRSLGWPPAANIHGARTPGKSWFAATAALTFRTPAALTRGMQSPGAHAVETASFSGRSALLVAGGPDLTGPQVEPRWSIVLYLFAVLPCDILSGFLVFSERVAYPVYLAVPGHTYASVLADQQCAGALMWTVVTVVISSRGPWSRPRSRPAIRGECPPAPSVEPSDDGHPAHARGAGSSVVLRRPQTAWLADYWSLTKPEVKAPSRSRRAPRSWGRRRSPVRWIPLLHAVLGTILVASGAGTLNQWMGTLRCADAADGPAAVAPAASSLSRRCSSARCLGRGPSTWPRRAAWLRRVRTLVSYLWLTRRRSGSPLCTLIGAVAGAMPAHRLGRRAVFSTPRHALRDRVPLVFPHVMAIA